MLELLFFGVHSVQGMQIREQMHTGLYYALRGVFLELNVLTRFKHSAFQCLFDCNIDMCASTWISLV